LSGSIEYENIEKGVTYQVEIDEQTGFKEKVISESRNKKIVPTLLINDNKGKNIRTYNLPVGAPIMVNDGDKVKEGEIICKQSVDARQAKLDEANALMKQKELEWQASKTLVEKGYRSQTQLAASSASYDASKALVKQMEQELDNINIRAPFDGIFNEKLEQLF
jgi:hypothetical protein